MRIACLDIGGTAVKAALADEGGLGEISSEKTRAPLDPATLVSHLLEILESFDGFDGIAVGFPGVIVGGVVHTADNIGEAALWHGFDLATALSEASGVEVVVGNDADVAALGAAKGSGTELTVTLGTGVGTGLTVNGVLQSHLELSKIPIGGAPSLDAYVGVEARKEVTERVWDERCREVLELLDRVVHPDQIWLAGGNARRVTRSSLGALEERVWVLTEPVGLLGGAKLFTAAQ